MSNTSSETLHEAIQQVLSAGDFEKTRELSSALGQAIIREAQTLVPAERSLFAEQGLMRIKEHLDLARVLRAHVATRLQENTALCLYQESSQRGNSWQFDA